jgi:hypothetical protein
MKHTAYGLFELVAWPAVAWGAIEIALRFGAGYGAGLPNSLLITSAGVATVTACRLRRAALVPIAPRPERE